MYIPKPKQSITTEETFVLLKPDVAEHHRAILDAFYDNGFLITAKTFSFSNNPKLISTVINKFPSVVAAEAAEREKARQQQSGTQSSGPGLVSSLRTGSQQRMMNRKTASFQTRDKNSKNNASKDPRHRRFSQMSGLVSHTSEELSDDEEEEEDEDEEPLTIVWRNRTGADARSSLSNDIIGMAKRSIGEYAGLDDDGGGGGGGSSNNDEESQERRLSKHSNVSSDQTHSQQSGHGHRLSISSSKKGGAEDGSPAPTTTTTKKSRLDTADVLKHKHKEHLMGGGTCLAVVLSAVDAITKAIELAGPDDPVEAQQLRPKSLHALYGTTPVKNGLFVASSHNDAAELIHAVFGFEMQFKEEVPGGGGLNMSTRGGKGGGGGGKVLLYGPNGTPLSGPARVGYSPSGSKVSPHRNNNTFGPNGGANSQNGAGGRRRSSVGSLNVRPSEEVLGIDDDDRFEDLVEKLRHSGLTAVDLTGEDDPIAYMASQVLNTENAEGVAVPAKLTQSRSKAIYDDMTKQRAALQAQAKLLRARELDLLLREQELQKRLDGLEQSPHRKHAVTPSAASPGAGSGNGGGSPHHHPSSPQKGGGSSSNPNSPMRPQPRLESTNTGAGGGRGGSPSSPLKQPRPPSTGSAHRGGGSARGTAAGGGGAPHHRDSINGGGGTPYYYRDQATLSLLTPNKSSTGGNGEPGNQQHLRSPRQHDPRSGALPLTNLSPRILHGVHRNGGSPVRVHSAQQQNRRHDSFEGSVGDNGGGFDLPSDPLEIINDPISLKELFLRHDVNGNNQLEKEEFLRLYKNTPELHVPGLPDDGLSLVLQELRKIGGEAMHYDAFVLLLMKLIRR